MTTEAADDEGGVWVRVKGLPVSDAKRPGRFARVVAIVKQLTIILVLFSTAFALFSTAVTVIFAIRPNVQSSTKQSVAIKNVTLQPDVALGSYLRRPYISGLIKAGNIYLRTRHQANTVRGELVEFVIDSEGLRNEALPIKWQLINAETGKIITTSDQSDPFTPLQSTAHKKDLDVGTWESWVDTTKATGKRVYIEIELYDNNKLDRLTFKDTKSFKVPA